MPRSTPNHREDSARSGLSTSAGAPWAAARHVLVLHAHPDDETIATGGTLAMLAATDIGLTLVTATRGERGEVVDGPLSALEGTAELGPYREGELARALRVLGVSDQRFLGSARARRDGLEPRVYRDSGMQWGPDGLAIADPTASADSFCLSSFDEAFDDLLEVAKDVEPDVVISYNSIGGYGHPDHVRCYELAVALASQTGARLLQVIPLDTAESHVPADGIPVYRNELGDWFETKREALRQHRTQLTVDGDDLVHSGGQRQAIGRTELFEG
ncbi:PIG-L deacetylase family protein [Lysinibacter cavernae]|uniref:N-acetyl-1-D-myo-inositol-2-amino-2-deoxy-alpha-D-glucopyranoside deacetylase n=1 Tax=Lysinibacter cavernae TaxID=1640652 RepID=A0A7X5R2U5_9MICO|nr:PIG-L family deacetylase [Lysinibacter cavernae]NIH54629.1 N-acetyl-1-D-myo-inositol-2-amino-2-deoxy-alpha-D-glucopyranoside deacetylase [Lysinibacter cavernae]